MFYTEDEHILEELDTVIDSAPTTYDVVLHLFNNIGKNSLIQEILNGDLLANITHQVMTSIKTNNRDICLNINVLVMSYRNTRGVAYNVNFKCHPSNANSNDVLNSILDIVENIGKNPKNDIYLYLQLIKLFDDIHLEVTRSMHDVNIEKLYTPKHNETFLSMFREFVYELNRNTFTYEQDSMESHSNLVTRNFRAVNILNAKIGFDIIPTYYKDEDSFLISDHKGHNIAVFKYDGYKYNMVYVNNSIIPEYITKEDFKSGDWEPIIEKIYKFYRG